MSDQVTQLRLALTRALDLPPDERAERLAALEQDCQQLAEAQGEGMQGADIAPVLSEIRDQRARLAEQAAD